MLLSAAFAFAVKPALFALCGVAMAMRVPESARMHAALVDRIETNNCADPAESRRNKALLRTANRLVLTYTVLYGILNGLILSVLLLVLLKMQ